MRSNGPAMRETTAALTDAEIEALALYISEM
jgi:cytochrome c553